jgi:hypothetical protein
LQRQIAQVRVEVNDLSQALVVAQELEYVQQAEPLNGHLEVTLEPGRSADLNATLVGAGLRVAALVPHSPDLEQVYLELMKR